MSSTIRSPDNDADGEPCPLEDDDPFGVDLPQDAVVVTTRRAIRRVVLMAIEVGVDILRDQGIDLVGRLMSGGGHVRQPRHARLVPASTAPP